MATKSKTTTETHNWFGAFGKMTSDALDGLEGAVGAYETVETQVLDRMKETVETQVSLARQMRELTLKAARSSMAWLG